MTDKKWTAAACVLIAVAILALLYGEGDEGEPAPFLESMSLDQVSYQTQWEQFRQKAGISDEARIEDFHLIQKGRDHVYSLRFRIVDERDGSYAIYNYNRCFACTAEEENKDYLGKTVSDEWVQYPRLLEAKQFFAYLDAGLRERAVRWDEYPYYLITSSGEYESLGMPGTYYRLSQAGLTKMEFESRPSADGFNLQIIGSETPGPFSVDEKTVHLMLSF